MPISNPYTPPGAQAAPAVPASTVAQPNNFGRACLVTVRGGTVTVIAVNGATVGTTAGTFVVPVGGTITITYTVAPAWDWFSL